MVGRKRRSRKGGIRGRSRRAGSRLQTDLMVDGTIGCKKVKVPGVSIRSFTANPKIQRWVRVLAVLSGPGAAFNITPETVATQDFLDYGVTAPRYTKVRFVRVRAWAESAPDPAAFASGISITEQATNYTVQEQPAQGSSLAAVGMVGSLNTRQALHGVMDDVNIWSVVANPSLTAEQTVRFTVDSYVEFT